MFEEPRHTHVSDKPWRVITKHGLAWVVQFKTEEAAWGRLLALKGYRGDTSAHRAALLREGWKVRELEVTSGVL